MTKKEKSEALGEILRFIKRGETKKLGCLWGLCTINSILNFWNYHLSGSPKYKFIDKLIRTELKRNKKGAYLFKPAKKAPRIKWLKQQIEKLEVIK